MDEMLQQFVVESREIAEQTSYDLLMLEAAPQDTELLDVVLRALHTLKGSAGIVEFHEMEQALHGAEDVLGTARRNHATPASRDIALGLACLDRVLEWLDTIARTGELPADSGARPDASRREVPAPLPVHPQAEGLPAEARDLLVAQQALVEGDSPRPFGDLASAAIAASNVLRHCGRTAEADRLAGLVAATPGTADLRRNVQAALSGVLAAPVNADQAQAAPRTGHAPQISASTVRIPAERVDALVRLTGELTVATNALAHLGATAVQDGNPLAAQLRVRQAVFEHLTQELQRSVLALRVMPLRAVFQRFPRLLRGIAEDLGKSIQLKTSGEDTEADKAVVEMLFEPLLHVVRNAADHGVEDGELRAQRHKPPTATIELRASRHGDQVLVEVQDDGGGMDLQAIRTAARGHGVTDDAMDAMTDQQIVDLVFTPGFSTAGAVTHLSGRGVGMDAVQAAIGRLGGSVSIQSRAGEGTTVRFTLPFSIMMTSVMSVQAGGQMFGVPLDYVQEAVRVPRESLSAVGAAQALVLRNQTIPVIELSTMVGDTISRKDTEATIVVACFAGQRCGLEVDKVGERLDIILKPLDGLLAGTPGISGTTLLGDGRVLLVLDIPEMLQ